jgi:selenocysteine-specific elongation factor
MYVIGTAGHVDHGKSTLVTALTGIDPDRLREEKERGLTIDLGFAWLTLPSGREVSIVDVPGHERFIKNMLAGAGGVDLALLVVAADEGPMPQTREHLAILDLLDVPAAVVVITKCDLVDDDYADLVEAEVADILAATRFAGSPATRVSGATGAGLRELLEVIDRALDHTPPKRDLGRPRLPIDRAFIIQGFGAVVTGTLVDGSLEVGMEVEFQPGRLKARIRGLQRHKTKVQRLEPGTRAAVNLSGVHVDELRRGMVLALPGAIVPAHALDVRLKATKLLSHRLSHDAGVTVLCATAESQAKLRLLDRDQLGRGEEAWAQLVLESPMPAVRGDHCIVRTPDETAAGGVIVAINPRRRRRNHAGTIAALELQRGGPPEERLAELLGSGPLRLPAAAKALGLEAVDAEMAATTAFASGTVVRLGDRLAATAWLDSSIVRVVAAAEEFLAANRLRSAAPREHVRTTSRLEPSVFDLVVADGVARGRLEDRGSGLAPPGHTATLTPADQAIAAAFLTALRAGAFSPPTDHLPPPPLLAYLAEQGLVEDTGAGVVFDKATYVEMEASVVEHIRRTGSVSLAQTRDLFATSRKYAQALLEHLDARKVTRRVGESRILR